MIPILFGSAPVYANAIRRLITAMHQENLIKPPAMNTPDSPSIRYLTLW